MLILNTLVFALLSLRPNLADSSASLEVCHAFVDGCGREGQGHPHNPDRPTAPKRGPLWLPMSLFNQWPEREITDSLVA